MRGLTFGIVCGTCLAAAGDPSIPGGALKLVILGIVIVATGYLTKGGN